MPSRAAFTAPAVSDLDPGVRAIPDPSCSSGEGEPGVYVTDVLPVPGINYGLCRFCGEAIQAGDDQMVRVIVVAGSVDLFHAGCFVTYAHGLAHVGALLAAGPEGPVQ